MKAVQWLFVLWTFFAVPFVEASSLAVDATSSPNEELQGLLVQLTEVKLSKLSAIIDQLEVLGGDAMLPLFNALLDGKLYYKKSDRRLLVVRKDGNDTLQAEEMFTNHDLGIVDISTIKKIRVNNKLRGQLREAIARIYLNADNVAQRLNAVRTMMSNLNESSAGLLKERLEKEGNSKVKAALKQAIALHRLKSSQSSAGKIAAVNELSGSLEAGARNEIGKLLAKDGDGNYLETDTKVRAAARKALKRIDGKIEFYEFIEQLFFGLSLGSVLLLAAIGLAITFGVMGVINMAHGEMMMLGAYTTYVVQLLMPNMIDYSLWVAIPAAFIVAGSVGILIERGVIRFLHGRPLETLLATFGISLILQQAVRSIFSPLNRQVATPEWMSGSLEINSVLSFTYNRLYILLFALIVFVVLLLVLKKTSLGLNVRAVSQNRDMAKAMGIKTEWVDAMTFGLGSGIAGIAGVALSQLTNVGPNLGQSYIIDSFMVVVFGGVGNLWGTLVAGFTLGISNKFLEPVTGAVLATILILVFIILFIQKRPKGLFPQKGRAAND